ncbi:hypothetical protein N7474_000926 [Penicillium riverlandense]|uniref:uncharacterized protein n=1 Tax=Penicillium riverlandense TaxID=1903569 RepID=UPI002548E7B1|nr:uncharacterized protein N7474_000926 [Penicillium riverlandense]KAJ5832615.1 hypothetical protein N7474_000926 [Penicillium riverlandense]
MDLSTLNTSQQGTLFGLLLLGHAIPISSAVLMVRKRALGAKLDDMTNKSKQEKYSQCPTALEIRIGHQNNYSEGTENPITGKDPDGHDCKNSAPKASVRVKEITMISSIETRSELDQLPPDDKNHSRNAIQLFSHMIPKLKSMIRDTRKYLTSRRPVHGDELGGVEYKALSFLSVIVPLYFIMFLILGILSIGSWLSLNRPDIPRKNGVFPFWAGAFLATSAFANSGMSLVDASMIPFQLEHQQVLYLANHYLDRAFPLLSLGIFILAGNTFYPCLLRYIIWAIKKVLQNQPAWQAWRQALDYILAHPQRIYTNLFPARHTWFLLGSIVILNGINWGAFEILSIGQKVVKDLPANYRMLDGLFQALCLLALKYLFELDSADSIIKRCVLVDSALLQLINCHKVCLFYTTLVSTFLLFRCRTPFGMSVANTCFKSSSLTPSSDTNMDEEQSLGIYRQDGDMFIPQSSTGRPYLAKFFRCSYVYRQVCSRLSHDLWWPSLAVLFVTIIESGHYQSQPVAFSTFNIIFEVASAYSCVGVSVGYPGKNYSFCGEWHAISKLILGAVALRGRHRGLPVTIDKIILPLELWN